MAAIDGVDCLWVGHFDLSVSLGIPGAFDNKIFTDAIGRVAAATKKHGKALGRLVPSVESGIEVNRIGFDVAEEVGVDQRGDGVEAGRERLGLG